MNSPNKIFDSHPYHFLLRDEGENYSLEFSVGDFISESNKDKGVVKFKKNKKEKVKNFIKKTTKEKKIKDTKTLKKSLEEFLKPVGSSKSATPITDPKVSSDGQSIMDKRVASAAQPSNPITRGYMPGFGVGLNETDLRKCYGCKETKNKDGKETYNYYRKKLKMDSEEAKDRTKEQGKDPSGELDKKSKYRKKKNFISKMRLSEIQKNKAIKMLEDILMNKKNQDFELEEKDQHLSPIIKKNLKTLKKQAEKEGLSISELIKFMKSE